MKQKKFASEQAYDESVEELHINMKLVELDKRLRFVKKNYD